MRVFVSAVGQHDNVGDTVLRRGHLQALREVGPMRIYVGHQTADQLGALGVRPEDETVASSDEWRSTLVAAIAREPILYAFDTGETELTRPFALRHARLAPLLAANRARGGRAALTGVGVRRPTRWRPVVSAAVRVPNVVTWRDEPSRRLMRVGLVAPDWAFAHAGAALGEGPRPLLAFAIRCSLPHAPRPEPDDAWADAAAALAAEAGLQPVFVAQIGRDGPLAERLAARARGEALVWESPDHAAFERRLRAVYARSAAVVGDRLHGLVIGATEGALPLPMAVGGLDKAVRTLEAAGLTRVAVHPALHGAGDRLRSVLDRRDELVAAVVSARLRLEELTDRIRGTA